MNDIRRDGRSASTPLSASDAPLNEALFTRGSDVFEDDLRSADSDSRNQRARLWINCVFTSLWLGGLCAYVWGYFGSALFHNGDFRLWMSVAAAAFGPVLLVAVATEIMIQGRTLARTSHDIARITRRLSEPEGPALQRVALVTSAVRRELDVLSGALDATLDRVAAVETLIENQVSAIERAGSRAQTRAQVIGEMLGKERDGLSSIADELTANATRVAETIQTQSARVNEANADATQSLLLAETSLTRQLQNFQELTEMHAKSAITTVHDIETVAARLRDLSAASQESARALTSSIESQHQTLAQTTQKLDSESQRLAEVFERQATLIGRIEFAAQNLGERLETVLDTAGHRVDDMFGTLNARTGAASDALRAETEAALIAGGNVASAIEQVAAQARVTTSSLRETIAVQIDAFNTALSEGLRSLDGAASATGHTLSSARHEAQGFTQSLDETVRGIEMAGQRLAAVLEGIGERSEATRETLDDASRALAHHMSEVPDLAAEHASRISALLEDQASRMAALANALGGRMTVPQAPAQTARPPQDIEHEAPGKPAAASIIPLATAPSTPPEDDEIAEPDSDAPVTFSPTPIDQRSGLAAFGRIGQRLRQVGQSRAASKGGAALMAIEGEPESELQNEQHAPEPSFEEDEQSHTEEAPSAIYTAAARQITIDKPETPAYQPATTSGGFWSALFARIEGEDLPDGVMPQGAALAGTEEPQGEELRTQHALETLYAIAIDLDRLLEEEPPIELWKRYRAGEADVFARRLLTLRSSGLIQRIRHKYRDDLEFREHADRFRARFSEADAIDETPAARLNSILDEALTTIG